MLTNLGKFLRKIRIDRGEILKDMADNLGVSSAFLSAVENGKKKMPVSWYDKLADVYSFSDEQAEELRQAVINSSDVIELNIKGVSQANRDLALSFAREFDSIDDELAEKLFSILNSRED